MPKGCPENDEESLLQSLKQSEAQVRKSWKLQQVEEALAICRDDEAKLDLYALQDNILQVINLTKENLNSLNLEKTDTHFKDELIDLPGSKCQAPYIQNDKSSDIVSFHNALIMNIESNIEDDVDFNDIKVRVMYVNPVCREMIPCPYYLEGDCKFPDDKCHYSHGQIVNFHQLKEFKEPDFSLIKENAVVLAKNEDNLWQRAFVILTLPDENQCKVRFECGVKKEIVLDLHDVLPLDEASRSTSMNDYQVDDEISKSYEQNNIDLVLENGILETPILRPLGEWEKHTKSIGSKLMANMGYVIGTGLGKNSDGRIEPVPAVVLPPGKSLDHCMALRVSSGGDPDLFKAERIHKKLQERELKLSKKQYEKRRNKQDVFSFINTALSSDPKLSKDSSSDEVSLKHSSERSLNVEKFKVGENIRKMEKETVALHQTLMRLPVGSVKHKEVQKRLSHTRSNLSSLKETECKISKEQLLRETKKKMTVF